MKVRVDIAELLRAGLGNNAIAKQLHCDRAVVARSRAALRIPNVSRQPLTLEQTWASNTREVEGGHLEWTGLKATGGTPVMSYRGKMHTATRIAFRIKHGREPVGYVFAECALHHCVSPDCVDDDLGRARTREQLRYLTGSGERPEKCTRGHDLAEHGAYGTGGTSYCRACKRERRQQEGKAADP